MKKFFLGLFVVFVYVQMSFAQESTYKQEVIDLSSDKWQWMADKDVDKLATLFHDKSKFACLRSLEGRFKYKNQTLTLLNLHLYFK